MTEEEREFVVYRLKYQGQIASRDGKQQAAQAEEFDWKYVKQAFTDWQILGHLFVYWGVSVPDLNACSIRLMLLSDRLSLVWNLAVLANDYPRLGLQPELCPAHDGSDLHHRSNLCHRCGLLLGSRGQAKSICDWLHVSHAVGFHNVSTVVLWLDGQ